MKIFLMLNTLLVKSEVKGGYSLLFLFLFVALLDVVGAASIMPFMAVVGNPDVIEDSKFLAAIFGLSGIQSIDGFLVFLGFSSFFLLLFSTILESCSIFTQLRFSLACEYKLGRRLIAAYLRQPYDWFSSQNSADLGKNILSEVSTVVHQVLIPLLILVSQSIICVALCILLIFVDPIVALFSVFALSFAYLAIFAAFKGFLTIVGRERLDANTKRYSAVMECFQAIKEVKVLSLESTYVSKYNQPAKAYAGFVAASQTIAQLPRYFVEAIAFGGLIFFVLFSIGRSGFSESLPFDFPVCVLWVQVDASSATNI